MSKIIVSLYGGLGNQLFQYAVGRSLAIRNKADLVLDLGWFEMVKELKGTTPRKFALSPFNIECEFSNIGLPWHKKSLFNRVRKHLSFFNTLSNNRVNFYSEKTSSFDAQVFNLKMPIWLDGYWQSHKYFDSISQTLKFEINSATKLNGASLDLREKIIGSDSICVHIRRGDYVTNRRANITHGICGEEYYKSGFELLGAGMRNPHAYIFSDDPDWVRHSFEVPFESTIVNINGPDEPHQDLWLMAACRNFLIANSTFSWWGAWLGCHENKMVVAPIKWFASKSNQNNDLIPSEWIRL